jgi:hypothetical protein
MRDIDLREIDLKKLRVSRRMRLWLIAGIVIAAAGFLGWRYVTHPPRPWLVRWKLDHYLAKQAHTSNFKVDFPFPAKAEMAKRPKAEKDRGPLRGSRTGKDFETLREEYLGDKPAALALAREIKRSEANLGESKSKLDVLTKQLVDTQAAANETNVSNLQSNITAMRTEIAGWERVAARRSDLQAKEDVLVPIVDDLWEFQRAWLADNNESAAGTATSLAKARAQLLSNARQQISGASSYEAMYQALGQELFVAQRILASGNPEHRREGVTIALAAAQHALGFVMNGSVAARICEGYILPNLDLATDRNPRSTFNEENLLGQCADIFRRNEEPNNVVRTYEIYLAEAKNPQRADWARSQIAMAQEQAGNAKGALTAIHQIKDTNTFRFLLRRVPRLEQDAKNQR